MRTVLLFLAYLVSLLVLAAAYGAEAAVPPALVPIPDPSPVAEDAAFAAFVKDFRPTALAAGIAPATYDAAMGPISRNARIAGLNLNQPEFSRPVWDYLDNAVSPQRISDGKALLAGDMPILAPIVQKYRVPAEVLVSIWGNETDYGRGTGRYNLFEALATLAYSGPRADYAKPQLIAALKILQREHYDPAAMTSSWAGAFGQTQFVPTTFLAQAVDGDDDGKIDLWLNPADALASTAHLLAGAGYDGAKPWGYEVVLPPGFAFEQAELGNIQPISFWKARGVRTAAGAALPHSAEPGAIYLPAGARGPAFMIFANFRAVLRYNNATSYALAVCLLADQMKGAPMIAAAWPRDLAPLSRNERFALQDSLVKLGFDIGAVDGMIGAKSRAAVRQWQKAHALPADGFATQDLLGAIATEAQRLAAR